MNSKLIYFDNNSTTPLDDRVLNSMIPFFKEFFANANSNHQAGILVNNLINKARNQVAELINANSKEIVFTSGATESINLALKGIALHHINNKRHIVTVQTEHKAVLDTCKYLESIGFEIDYLPVNKDGLIDLKTLQLIIKKDQTLLVCVMWVNNETGVIQPIQEISKMAHANGALFMTDATQAVGKIKIDVFKNEVDIMCFSPHKFYGPKGVGALYLNRKSNAKNILALHHGGGHENGLRSGTLNVPAIVGFGKACEIAVDEMDSNEIKIRSLRDSLEKEILKIDGAFINGNANDRIFNTTNISFSDFDANIFIGKEKEIAVSNGSACSSALIEPSHVLINMGLNEKEAFSSLRISLSKYNVESEIEQFINTINSYTRNGNNLL